MPTNTYVALDRVTITGSPATVTFSSIPQGYTDLVLVANARGNYADSLGIMRVRFNSDTGSNYSMTQLYGNGSSAASARVSNQTSFGLEYVSGNNASSGVFSPVTLQLQNYSNATTFKTVLARTNDAAVRAVAQVGLWRSTSAITSITIDEVLGTNWAVGSTFSLYGVAAQVTPGTAKATGGTITYDSYGYVYHTFTSNGTFTPSQALSCDVLAIAGGGGGGSTVAGGGGAGGLLYTSGSSVASGTNYAVVIGAGGAGGTSDSNGIAGSNSTFNSLTAIGGGAGGGYGTVGNDGGAGGSGGGAGSAGIANKTGGAGTSGQGNAGGNVNITFDGGGGGGGAGAAGATNSSGTAGAGGAGVNTYSSWATTTSTGVSGFYAGGGGGGANTSNAGAGGSGGGGAGGKQAAGNPATVNTGGGGGGGGGNGSRVGAAGGSGIIIIRYAG